MADPTTPAEREALRIAAEAANVPEPPHSPSKPWLAWNSAQWDLVEVGKPLILRLLSDLAAAEAQIAAAKREGMMEAAGIAETSRLPLREVVGGLMAGLQTFPHEWPQTIAAAIRAASGGRDGDR